MGTISTVTSGDNIGTADLSMVVSERLIVNPLINKFQNISPQPGSEMEVFNVMNVTGSESSKSVQPGIQNVMNTPSKSTFKNNARKELMKTVIRNIYKSAVFAIAITSMALGQGTPKLDISIEDQKINLSATEIEDPTTITYAPGDTLRYVITAANIGDAIMTSPEIIDPVPTGVTYVASSARGINTKISFSQDQGTTYMAWPVYYSIRNSNGILVKRVASPDMISHIKWSFQENLKPEEKSTCEFMVVVK